MSRGRGWTFFFDLMSPPRAYERRLCACRLKDFFLQIGLAHDSGNQGQAISAFSRDPMLEAVLAGPLRHAAGEIDFTSADLPAFVGQLDYHAHGSRADDA